MKATLLTSAVMLCALAAFAADQQQQPTSAAQKQGAPTVEQTLSATPTQAREDSPLVAAAKRTGRLGKKPGQVITNDTLVKSGGHFTTTKSQDALGSETKQPARSGSDKPLTTNNNPAPAAGTSAAAPAAKKAEEKKSAASSAARRAAAAFEGDTLDTPTDDPATQEGVMAGGGARQPEAAAKPATPRPPTE